MAKENKKFLPFKNWLYLLIIIVIVILGIWYIASWHNVKQKELYMNSYLVSTNTVSLEFSDTNEISQSLLESPEKYFIYISYTGDKDIYKLEKRLKSVIDNYGLHDIFYFVNVTDEVENETLLSDLNDSFNTTDITNVPCILYFEHDKIQDVIVNKNDVFSDKDLINLLKEYEYERK